MAAEVSVFLLLEKLKKLLAEEKVIFPGLRNRIHDAINELEKILSVLKVETSSQTTSDWEARLQLTIYSAEQITDHFLLMTIQQRQKGLLKFPLAYQLRSQQHFSREMNKLVANLRAMFHELPEPRSFGNKDVNSNAIQSKGRILAYSYEKSDSLVGRGDAIKDILARLIHKDNGNLRVIPVVNEEALGKTALARNIYNRTDVRRHFEWRGWLNVHKDTVYRDILVNLLMQTPICVLKDAEQMKEIELSELLYKFLMEHRFLIVLDDVCSVDIWHMLVFPFADSANGSRVILTTRNIDVALHADPWTPPFKLSQLTDEASWELFLKKVRRPESNGSDKSNTNTNTDLNIVREKILRKCKGLPPAIGLLGGLFSKTESNEWSTVIDLAKFGEDQSSLQDMVDLCHRKLPSRLKPCFHYLGLFPKAYEIPTRRLLRLWLAEGFLPMSSEVNMAPEDVAKVYLEELVSRNMIEIASFKWDGSPKTCRMPSFLYDMFSPKVLGIGFLYINHCNSVSRPEKTHQFHVRRLADHLDTNWSTSDSDIQHICSYVSFDYKKRDTFKTGICMLLQLIISKSGFGSLKVLDLEGVYKPMLPKKLGKYFPNLKYISLRWTGLNSFPSSIADLPCLETLDLKYTNITTLPSSIWKAKKLRHLYMNEVYIRKSSSRSLINLQTLLGLFIGSKSRMIHGLNKCTGLRTLGLTCHPESTKKTTECISRLNNLQTLRLRSRNRLGQPMNIELSPEISKHQSLSKLYLFGMITDDLSNLPKNLKILTLSMSGLKEDPMPMLGKLSQLNILRLFHSFEGSEMTCLKNQFPKLCVLKFWMLEELQKWTLEEGSMPELSELEVRRCEKLKTSDELDKLLALKELILTNMPKEFVEDVEKRMMSRDILITVNNWDFSPLPEY